LHRAKELAFFGDIINAAEAERIGLVNRVVADAQLDAFVLDWATRLAAGPPIALAQTKRLLNNSANVTLEEALDDEGAAQVVNFGTKDTVEAMTAFIEKREPRFIGFSFGDHCDVQRSVRANIFGWCNCSSYAPYRHRCASGDCSWRLSA
jgi:2-(1,2-epoxy-1,2-dihydrophenyl)acetyl-CoA isomerase